MLKVTIYQHFILLLLWLAYSSCYLLRKPLALIKTDLIKDLSVTTDMLGWLDVALLLPYAGVSLTMGWLAEAIGARTVMGAGLVLSAICYAGLTVASNMPIMCVLLFGTGASQALLWPAAGSLLVKWFPAKDRNYAFGVFGTSAFAGSVIATYFAVFFREICGWRGIFMPCAAVAACMGVLVLLFAHSPEHYGIHITLFDPVDDPLLSEQLDKNPSTASSSDQSKRLNFLTIMKFPMVTEVSLSILCMKWVRYAFLLWLPMFLEKALHYTAVNAGIASTVCDIGGIVGSLCNGFIVRKLFKSNNFYASSFTCFFTGAFMMAFFLAHDLSPIVHITLLTLVGLFNCTADVLLTGPIAANLGSEHGATVAVSGVINGMGSVGSVIQGPLVAWVGAALGWMAVLPFLSVVAVSGGFASLRAYRLQR